MKTEFLGAEDRIRFYGVLREINEHFPKADLQIVAIGMGAKSAVIEHGILNICLPDGSGFAYTCYLGDTK